MDLVEFLTARLAEDEAVARAIDDKQEDSGWGITTGPSLIPPYERRTKWIITPHIAAQVHEQEAAEHIARHDPARVLREVAAKRLMLDQLRIAMGGPDFNDYVLEPLAATYADHPDYRTEWAL